MCDRAAEIDVYERHEEAAKALPPSWIKPGAKAFKKIGFSAEKLEPVVVAEHPVPAADGCWVVALEGRSGAVWWSTLLPRTEG